MHGELNTYIHKGQSDGIFFYMMLNYSSRFEAFYKTEIAKFILLIVSLEIKVIPSSIFVTNIELNKRIYD